MVTIKPRDTQYTRFTEPTYVTEEYRGVFLFLLDSLNLLISLKQIKFKVQHIPDFI